MWFITTLQSLRKSLFFPVLLKPVLLSCFPVPSCTTKASFAKGITGVCWWVINCTRTSLPDHTSDHRSSLTNYPQGRFVFNMPFCYKQPANEGPHFGTPLCCCFWKREREGEIFKAVLLFLPHNSANENWRLKKGKRNCQLLRKESGRFVLTKRKGFTKPIFLIKKKRDHDTQWVSIGFSYLTVSSAIRYTCASSCHSDKCGSPLVLCDVCLPHEDALDTMGNLKCLVDWIIQNSFGSFSFHHNIVSKCPLVLEQTLVFTHKLSWKRPSMSTCRIHWEGHC